MFGYNSTIDQTVGDGRAKKLNQTHLGPNSQVQGKNDQKAKHNFF